MEDGAQRYLRCTPAHFIQAYTSCYLIQGTHFTEAFFFFLVNPFLSLAFFIPPLARLLVCYFQASESIPPKAQPVHKDAERGKREREKMAGTHCSSFLPRLFVQ